jgi:hypothetical protein
MTQSEHRLLRQLDCSGFQSAGEDDPEFGEVARLGVELNRSRVLLDDDVIAQRKTKTRSLSGRLVVKKGLNIRSLISGEIPPPLSRIRISTRSSPIFLVEAVRVGS